MGAVHIRDVLRQISEKGPTGHPVSFALCGYTYDKKHQSGGKRFEYNGVLLLTKDTHPNALPPARRHAQMKVQEQARKKNPHHFLNSTRNLLLPDGNVRKVNVWLITEFNGMEVLQ